MGNSEQEVPSTHLSNDQTGANRYKISQKIVSLGKDYWIENEQGVPVYQIDGKVLTWKQTFDVKDAQGNKLARIKKILLKLKESMEIEGIDGEQLAVVSKDLFTILKEHYVVKLKNGPDLAIHGNLLDHEYTIGDGQKNVAHVSKQWLNIRDSYSVSIASGQNDMIILAVVVCIDEMSHSTR